VPWFIVPFMSLSKLLLLNTMLNSQHPWMLIFHACLAITFLILTFQATTTTHHRVSAVDVSPRNKMNLITHMDMKQLFSRNLNLIANSIHCSETADTTAGSFCGSISISNYSLADAATYFQAAKIASLLGTNPAYGVRQYVVKYKTQIQKNGTPIDATGIVALPVVGTTTSAPAGGFPILMIGHFSVGVADKFAPSQTLAESTDVVNAFISSFLRNYVAHGSSLLFC